MFRLMTSVAFALAALSIPAFAQADKCSGVGGPGKLRKQCAIELGGYCNPATGRVILRGPSTGVIKGAARMQECVDRKRAELRGRKS